MSKISKIETAQDLALVFYNDMVENGDDSYDPDSKFTRTLNEIETILMDRLDFKTVSRLEGLILVLSSEDVQQHYIWGFTKALEVARLVFDSDVEVL